MLARLRGAEDGVMRLRRLDLTRFGAFTDVQIDFGGLRTQAGPAYHLRTQRGRQIDAARRAGDLLFGIPVQSDYAFLHDYKAMEIGATVDTRRADRQRGGGSSGAMMICSMPTAARRAALVLDAALGGMDRKTFEMMFSLDGETLKEGGEELHRSRGRLGEALFAATSGLSSISAALEGGARRSRGVLQAARQETAAQ